MVTQRERFERYFGLPGPKDSDREQVLLAVADAFDAAMIDGDMTEDRLRVIVQAVSSPKVAIWESCCGILGAASERWPNAAEAILQISRQSHAHVRFNAICSLTEKTPAHVVNEVLKNGLSDRSARVRWKAADQACSLNQHRLIPDIAKAVNCEVNPKAKSSINFSLHFLRDGFLVRRNEDGSYNISIRLFDPPGGQGGIVQKRWLGDIFQLE